MDPNACLDEILELVKELKDADPYNRRLTDVEDAVRLSELIEGLDGWLSGGGFLPERWTRTKVHVHPGTEPVGHVEMKKTRR